MKIKNITVEPLFNNYKNTIRLYIDKDSEIVLIFERNNTGLNKTCQVLSEQTSDSCAFLNAMCL
jgi:hypothetical protein